MRTYRDVKKDDAEHFIHVQQYATESLANQIIDMLNPVTSVKLYEYSTDPDNTDCLKITFAYLEKLIRFIEREFAKFIDVNINIPSRFSLLDKYGIKTKVDSIVTGLKDVGISERLFVIASEPFNKVMSNDIHSKLTYKEFNYCLEYINELDKHIKLPAVENSDEALYQLIFSFNLNTLTFFDYKTDMLVLEMNTYLSIQDKLDFLYRKYKIINQRQTRSTNIFDERFLPIKQQILGWLEQEIEYLNRKTRLEQPHDKIHDLNNVADKILSALSVSELSYLFNLFTQVGIINQKNKSDIFKFIAANFKTKNADPISADSIKSKFYNVELTTKATIREKLFEMLNLTKS